MDFDRDDGESYFEPVYDSLPDYHLRNPLKGISEELLAYDEPKGRLPLRKRACLDQLKQHGNSFSVGEPTDLILCAQDLIFFESVGDVRTCLGDVQQRLRHDSVFDHIYDVDGMEKGFNEFCLRVDVDGLLRMRNFQQLVVIMNALSSRRPLPDSFLNNRYGDVVILSSARYTIYVTGSYIGLRESNKSCETAEEYLMRSGSSRLILYDGDWVRCASDVHTERFLLNAGSLVGNYMAKDHYPSWEFVSHVISWGDNILSKFRNEGYKLLKAYEALCTGYIMSLGDDVIVDKNLFYTNTRNDLIIENLGWLTNLDELHNIFIKSETIHWMSQIYGIHRIWGHPIVNSLKGMEKVIMIGRKNITLSDKMPRIISCHFKFLFCKGFRSKYKRFPEMDVSKASAELQALIRNNDPKALDSKTVDLIDWESIILSENFQLPETFNLSMIVADKSVSPTRSELRTNIEKRHTVMNAELRRGVLRWINDTTIDPRPFLKDVGLGKFPNDHRIIGLTPKERELNPTPRMFALMSHLMRVYVVITESMLSEHLLPLFPQITMTDNLLELSKKIYGNVKNQQLNNKKLKNRYQRTICVSLDFEKWNGHMRSESTFGVFESLGRLFGIPGLYNQTYDIFKSSYIYLADGSYVPKITKGELIVDEPNSFIGHKGGMEGLRQKGWTLFTIICLDYVCSRHNCQYKLMGMGDNQVLMLTFYTYKIDGSGNVTESGKTDIKHKVDKLFFDLMDVFGELGLPLKPLETWMSESLFIYGKYPLFKGMPMTMDLKRIMRTFPFSNDDIMTTENILNTIAGGATSSAQSAPFVGVSYVVGLLMMLIAIYDLLIYHPLTGAGLLQALKPELKSRAPYWTLRTGSGKKETYDLIGCNISPGALRLLLSMIPRTLGGYVTFNLPTLIMRGFPDPLSRDLYVMKSWFTKGSSPMLDERLENWTRVIYMPEINLKLLIEDVLSVNTMRPVTPMAGVRQSVSNFLSNPGRVTNREFRDLMSIKNDDTERILAEQLCEGDYIHIRLMHDIYEASLIGYVDSIVSKVTKTSTIQRLAMSKARKDVSEQIIGDEKNYFKFFVWRSSRSGDPWNSVCETEHAKLIRRRGWGRTLKGVTIPFPLSFMRPTECYAASGGGCYCGPIGYMSVHISDNCPNIREWNKSLGMGLPYLGSMTKEKVTVQTGSKIYSSEPLVKRPVRLLRTINWFVPPESNCARVIKKCLESVTNVEPNQFVGVSEGTSGAESHRYHDSSLSHGTLSTCNYLYSTRCHISSDNFHKYSRGSKNCDIHFQAILCSITENCNQMSARSIRRADSLNRVYHWTESCPKCVTELDEGFTDLRSDGVMHFLPTRKDNRYLYVDQARISYIEDKRPYQGVIKRYLHEQEYLKLNEDYKYWLLVDSLADKISGSLVSKEVDEEYTNLVDLHSGQIFNRLIYLKVRPIDLFNCVIDRIYILSRARLLRRLTKGEALVVDKVYDIAEEIIHDAPIGNFIGLALFYSWDNEEAMRNLPGYVPADTMPITLTSACESVRLTLCNMVEKQMLGRMRSTNLVIEDLKDHGFSYYFLILDTLENIEGRCGKCVEAIAMTHPFEFARDSVELICDKGHVLMERYDLSCNLSRVSIDRLRKDCADRCEVNRPNVKRKRKLLDFTTVTKIIRSVDMRKKYIFLTEEELDCCQKVSRTLDMTLPRYSEADLVKVVTVPTSSAYKYCEVISEYSRAFSKSRRILVLGDGVGNTSGILLSLTDAHIVTSTLIDSETTIPQVMANLYESSSGELIDKRISVNKNNNILSPVWEFDWGVICSECDTVVSDIEIMGDNRINDRNSAVEKILKISAWKLAVIKDYIYSRKEFTQRLSIILRYVTKYDLITVESRQKGLPESWWVIENSLGSPSNVSPGYLSYPEQIMRECWNRYMGAILSRDNMGPTVVNKINKVILDVSAIDQMSRRAKSWARIEGVGCLIPQSQNFTYVLGRLQQGCRPKEVSFSRGSGGLKLYDSVAGKLREILMTIAVSMVGDIYLRTELANESHCWSLNWSYNDKTSGWMPFLLRERDRFGPKCVNVDFLGILSIIMGKKHLMFDEVGRKIKFSYSPKRQKLCFPVAKNMIIRLPK